MLEPALNPYRFTLPMVLLLGAGIAVAQSYTPPPPPLDAPCKPTKKDPCTAPASTVPPPPASTMAFPFPGDTTDAVKLDPNANPDDPAAKPAAPAQTDPAAAEKSGKFPFPGDAPASTPASSSSSSSSSGGTTAASDSDEDDPPVAAPASRRKLPKVEDTDARELKDIDISSYYYSTGQFLAAYRRGQDAVQLMPQDPEAHFVLAMAALKLLKQEEAREEFKLSLKLDVSDKHAKVAQAELAKLH